MRNAVLSLSFFEAEKDCIFCQEQHCPSLPGLFLILSLWLSINISVCITKYSGSSVVAGHLELLSFLSPPQLLTPKRHRRQLPTCYQALLVALLSCGQLCLQCLPAGRERSSTRALESPEPSHTPFHVLGHSSYMAPPHLFCPNSHVTSLEGLSLTSSSTFEVAPFLFASRCL